MNTPILFLRSASPTYQRDLDFALMVYQGAMPYYAATKLGMSKEVYWKLQDRLRARAEKWAGFKISDALMLRLMFDRERAEPDLQVLRETREKENVQVPDRLAGNALRVENPVE